MRGKGRARKSNALKVQQAKRDPRYKDQYARLAGRLGEQKAAVQLASEQQYYEHERQKVGVMACILTAGCWYVILCKRSAFVSVCISAASAVCQQVGPLQAVLLQAQANARLSQLFLRHQLPHV